MYVHVNEDIQGIFTPTRDVPGSFMCTRDETMSGIRPSVRQVCTSTLKSQIKHLDFSDLSHKLYLKLAAVSGDTDVGWH